MIPTRVQEAMRRLAAAVKYAHYRSKPEILAEHLADADIVEKWIEAQPEIPQPSWDDAPEWAMWWACNASGSAKWFGSEPETAVDRDYGDWVSTYRSLRDEKFYRIPLGIDWRELKQRRPEVLDGRTK